LYSRDLANVTVSADRHVLWSIVTIPALETSKIMTP